MTDYPGDYLIRWCRNLPAGYGVSLAHLYLICTGHDVSPLFLEGDEIWREFQNKMSGEDIPVRMAVRLVTAMSALSFILGCVASGGSIKEGGAFSHVLSRLDDRDAGNNAWLEITLSFEKLSETLCGPQHVTAWLEHVLHSAD